MPTNYSTCVRIRIQVLNISRDKISVVNVQPTKTAKFFNLENFRLYGTFWTFRIVCYTCILQVSAVEGCLLGGVPM